MLNPAVLDDIAPRHRSRRRFPRISVASEVPPHLNDALLDAVKAFDSNKSRIVSACIAVGLPILLEQAGSNAADLQH